MRRPPTMTTASTEPALDDAVPDLAPGRRWPSPLMPTAIVAGLLVCLKLGQLVLPAADGRSGTLVPRPAAGQAVASLEDSDAVLGPDGQRLDPLLLPLIEPSAGPATADAAASRSPAAPPTAGRRDEKDLTNAGMLADVAAELAERRDSLDQRERDLELRETVVTSAESRIAKQLERLEQLRTELKTLSDGVKAKDEAEITQLIRMYESMKAKSAALVFNELDLKVLLPIVKKMRDSKLASVIALMDPIKAKQITAALSQPTQLPRLP